EFNEGLSCGRTALPERGFGYITDFLLQDFHASLPATLSATPGPEFISFFRVPGGHVYAVGDISDWNVDLWPTRKERLKDAPAHLAVQPAHSVDDAATPHGEIGHIEIFRVIIRVCAAESEQVAERKAETVSGIPSEILLY